MSTVIRWCPGSAVLLTALLFLMGCIPEKVGETRIESESVELKGAEKVRVELKIGVGELRISGGAKKLLEADFIYNIPSWKPEVRYEVNGKEGTLSVRQPNASRSGGGRTRNEWNLSLNDRVPLDLRVECGVGKSNLELGSLLLEDLDIQTGVGETTVELLGDWKKDLHANVKGGVGQVTLRLPSTVGVHVESDKGIGSVNASGLRKEGNTYTNEAYGKSKVTLNIHVQAGIGEIRLELAD
jgi:hypothetical protein